MQNTQIIDISNAHCGRGSSPDHVRLRVGCLAIAGFGSRLGLVVVPERGLRRLKCRPGGGVATFPGSRRGDRDVPEARSLPQGRRLEGRLRPTPRLLLAGTPTSPVYVSRLRIGVVNAAPQQAGDGSSSRCPKLSGGEKCYQTGRTANVSLSRRKSVLLILST